MNIWKGSNKKTKKSSSSSGGATALECGDDGLLPDVLVGHAMLARQDHASRTSSSWQQQQQPPPHTSQQQQQQQSQHHAQHSAAASHQLLHHHHGPQIAQQPTPSLHQQPQQQQHHHHQQSQQYHASGHHQQQPAQASFTPMGLGAHGVDWRNEGASTSAASGGAFGGVPYQDPNRGYLPTHHSSFPEPDAATRYSQNCSGLPEADSSNLRYHHPGQNVMADSSDAHYGGQHHHSTGQEPDSRFGPSYSNPAPADTDGRYLAISVNDAGAAYGQQPFLAPEEDTRIQYSGASYQVDNGVTVRYRSMSSEPRSGRKDAENRRIRCSSANRVRQTRSRNLQTAVSPSAASPLASPPQATSPPPPSSLSVVQPQATPLPTTTSGSTVPAAQLQMVSSPSTMDRQNWDPGPSQSSQQASASSHVDPHTEERNYAMHPPVSSSTGSYGYQVEDLEALLSHSSASQPANLPMVLASPTRLHHMRRTQVNSGPSRPFLPLGVIVNAVFKTRDWLYVRTAHGAEGFVPYHVCLPLGILPTKPAQPVSESAAPAAAWEMQETPLPRGRCRERRRQSGSTSANQTDLQKLHPMSRTTMPRETLSSQSQQQQPQHQQPHQSSGSRN